MHQEFSMSSLQNVSALLLTPVHVAIYVLFIAALFESGRLVIQWSMRFGKRAVLRAPRSISGGTAAAGYPILAIAAARPDSSIDDLDLEAMRRLELIRIATRITPMLGLIATLIPMGPALVALTKNDVSQMSDLLRSAFSAVVLALAAATLCFWIATVRRRWCAEEVLAVKREREQARQPSLSPIDRRAA
jgi:hypothetical protein